MAVEITLEIEPTRFLWPSTPRAVVHIVNDGAQPVETQHEGRGACVLRAVDVETMRPAGEGPPPPTPGTVAPVTVAPGETVEEELELADRLRLSRAGMYAVRAHATFAEGEIASMPVRIEVVPSRPRAVCLATMTGGPAGHVWAAWVHDDKRRPALWLTLLSALGEASFLSSVEVAEVPRETEPVLSVPASRSPFAQHLAWLDGTRIEHAIHQAGGIARATLDLGVPGFRIVGPLHELPFDAHAGPSSEGLVLRETPGGWEMCAVVLGKAARVSDAVAVDTPMPVWARTAHRQDGSRCAVFFVPRLHGDAREMNVLVAQWAPGEPPATPFLRARWPGVLLAADQKTTSDGRVAGAALLDVGDDEPRYAIQRWHVLPDGRIEEGPLSWLDWQVRRPATDPDRPGALLPADPFLVRVDGFGRPYAMLARDGVACGYADGASRAPLPGAVQGGDARLLDVYFLDQTYPVLVHFDPARGLALCSTAPKRALISPAGIVV